MGTSLLPGWCVHGANRVPRRCSVPSSTKAPLPACGRMKRSARRSIPRPSRRFAKHTIEQCTLALLGTIAFCFHTLQRTALFFSSFFCAHGCLHDCLLDVSRLLGLTLRPSAPVFRCHLETFDTLEAGTCAGSRAWNFSSSSFFLSRRCA